MKVYSLVNNGITEDIFSSPARALQEFIQRVKEYDTETYNKVKDFRWNDYAEKIEYKYKEDDNWFDWNPDGEWDDCYDVIAKEINDTPPDAPITVGELVDKLDECYRKDPVTLYDDATNTLYKVTCIDSNEDEVLIYIAPKERERKDAVQVAL